MNISHITYKMLAYKCIYWFKVSDVQLKSCKVEIYLKFKYIVIYS